jgi:hypothetical protein
MRIRTSAQIYTRSEAGFQALENLTKVRWLILAFGTVPQAVKLMAFRGLYWTEAWGWVYVASFVFIEVLIISGKRNG